MATAELLQPQATESESLYRFSAEDFHQMGEAGVFNPKARVELLDGQIFTMSPIGPFHGGVVDQLSEFFVEQAKKRYIVRTQNSVRLGDHTEPQPDITLLRRDIRYFKGGLPATKDIFLVVEVSDSTLAFDVKKKLPIYARAGIPEVWIVDLADKYIRIHRQPSGSAYSVQLREALTASPAAFPDVQVDVAELLG